MTWQEIYKSRLKSAPKALRAVERGQRVFVGTACAEPQYLVQALMDRADDLHDVEILHFVTLGQATYTDRRFDRRFRHNAFFVGPATREAVNQARADYTPIFMHEIQELFASRQVPLDVALIQVSPPDPHGFVSLGIGVDLTRAAAENAEVVIAQVNPRMPHTMGNSYLHVRDITTFVEHEEELIQFTYPPADRVGDKIAANVAKLIRDRDTLHIGYGHIPYQVLFHLDGKKDLGLHTEVISDAIIPLIEKGIVTGRYKKLLTGRSVCSFAIGSREIYDYVDHNPSFLFLPSGQVYNPMEIAKNGPVVSVGSALEVDLSGQVSGESLGTNFYAGIGGRLDFMRGAAMSPGGRPIICLPSTTKDGKKSRIVPRLSEGAGVVATRGDMHYVVTEYGIAYLHGRTMRERAMALINIAHPKHRESLLEAAKEHSYVYPDQILLTADHDFYPAWAEAQDTLKDGTQVTIRPIKPTDEMLVQEMFYSHSEETVYNRYFRPVRALPHVTAQGMVNVDYENEMALVATTGPIGLEKIVGIARYSKDKEGGDLAEVAYTTHDDFNGRGLGTVMQRHLVDYSKKMGIKGHWAVSFGSNKAMLAVFNKLGEYTKKVIEPGIWRVEHRWKDED